MLFLDPSNSAILNIAILALSTFGKNFSYGFLQNHQDELFPNFYFQLKMMIHEV